MKKQLFVTLCGLSIATVLLIAACNKQDFVKEQNLTTNSPESQQNNYSARENSETINYFSRDSVTEQVYKLKLTKNSDGNFTIQRTQSGNHNGSGIWTNSIIHSEVNLEVTQNLIQVMPIKKLFMIPFNPSEPVAELSVIGGGGSSVIYRCNCTQFKPGSQIGSCDIKVTVTAKKDIFVECMAELQCAKCQLKATSSSSSGSSGSTTALVSSTSGYILVEADFVNEEQ